MSPRPAAARISLGAEARVGGQRGDAPGPRDLAAGRGRADRRPPGSRLGSAPASIAPRSPARRGIQASRAPVCAASRSGRGQRAGHLGQPLADEDHRAGLAQRGGAPRAVGSSASRRLRQRGERRGLGAWHRRQQRAGQLGQARGWRAPRASTRPCRAAGPPCAAAGTRSGTRPRARTRPAAPPAPARARRRSALTRPDHVLGEELEFLGRVRPGPHVDVVGGQRHPGELGVGVGVLDASAGRRAARRRGRARPAGRCGRGCQRLRPGGGLRARRSRRGPAG